jgi:hypothetical protein
VWNALRSTAPGLNRLEAFAGCGASWWLLESRTRPGVYKLTRDYCRDRWCLPCSRLRADVVAGNLLQALHGRPTRLITLTLRSSLARLHDQLHRLITCFRRLRRLPVWTNGVTGGAACIEITWNADTGLYNPHIHALTEGRFIPQAYLADEWERCTGDSRIVHITYVQNPNHAARYVTKYITKPVDNRLYFDDNALPEAIEALRGQKQLITFGTWRRFHLTRPLTEDAWNTLGHWNEAEYATADRNAKLARLHALILANPTRALTGEWTEIDLERPDTS